MNLYDQAKKDIEKITANQNEWAVEITLTAPSSEKAIITGLHTKHHLGVDTDGNAVNSKKAHISFSEKYLTDVNYPVRDANGEVSLSGHKISVKDSTGTAKKYIMQSWFPDETIGLITCIIQDYE